MKISELRLIQHAVEKEIKRIKSTETINIGDIVVIKDSPYKLTVTVKEIHLEGNLVGSGTRNYECFNENVSYSLFYSRNEIELYEP